MPNQYYVEFPEVAVNALKQGEWVVIEFEGLYCKVIPYPLTDQIYDSFNDKEIIFKPDFKKSEKNAKRNT